MTLRFVKRNLCYLAFLGLLVFTSCESNSNEELLNNDLTTEEALKVVLADDISSDVDDVIEDDSVESELASRGTTTSNHPSCLERTVENTTNGKIVTLDFGAGCEGKKGRVFAGKIIIEYVRENDSFSKTVSFENFSVNGNAIEGGMSATKVKENTNGNPERTHTVDITITLESGETIVKKGEKVKEKIAGADTKDRGDDVFLISGFWESVNKNGDAKKAQITTSLRREYACKYIVSGVVELTKGTSKYVLDFGDGSCDNLATITDEAGRVKEITLKNRKRK
ncbi:hypothetical protein SAMN04487765_1602 [Tenacibaculum sp. MAR_2010_89]|uniref:hypothetical protein n=1 Tax=Tenacibaculum sp. MAR_2010_89 TaxID=1250198 RepID=UPI00089D963F|nr:hypothetical protein [Tenacibaculum sp. MAR_2010_89]SEE16075.1 hypothetical protein SAMN04487765_1602 [Tenacibaculum sp. MAR_2010_89]